MNALKSEAGGDPVMAEIWRAGRERDKGLEELNRKKQTMTDPNKIAMLKESEALIIAQYQKRIDDVHKQEIDDEKEKTRNLAEQVQERVQSYQEEAQGRIDAYNDWVREIKERDTGFTTSEEMSQRFAEAGMARRYDNMLLPDIGNQQPTQGDINRAIDEIISGNNKQATALNEIADALRGRMYE